MRELLARLVLDEVDAEQAGKELAGEHHVVAYPTFVMLTPGGEVADRWLGYTKEMFIERVAGSLADLIPIAEREAHFAASPDAADAVVLARYAAASGEYEEAADLYRQAQTLAPGASYSMQIFDVIAEGAGHAGTPFTLADVRAAADSVLASPAATAVDLLRVARAMAAAATRAGEPELMVPYLETAFARSQETSSETVQRLRRELAPLEALYVEHDPPLAVEFKKADMGKDWRDDPSALNAFAWWCFENRVDLAEALALAERGTELEPPGRRRAMILDTAAEIASQLGDNARAVSLMEEAIVEDPDNEYYQRQLARFQDLLARGR